MRYGFAVAGELAPQGLRVGTGIGRDEHRPDDVLRGRDEALEHVERQGDVDVEDLGVDHGADRHLTRRAAVGDRQAVADRPALGLRRGGGDGGLPAGQGRGVAGGHVDPERPADHVGGDPDDLRPLAVDRQRADVDGVGGGHRRAGPRPARRPPSAARRSPSAARSRPSTRSARSTGSTPRRRPRAPTPRRRAPSRSSGHPPSRPSGAGCASRSRGPAPRAAGPRRRRAPRAGAGRAGTTVGETRSTPRTIPAAPAPRSEPPESRSATAAVTTAAAPSATSRAPSTARSRELRSATTTSSRIASTGGVSAARRAGTAAATMLTTSPTAIEIADGGGVERDLPRQLLAHPREHEPQPRDEGDARADPCGRAQQPDDGGLHEDRGEHLPRRGADRAQHRELPLPLPDDHLEGVGDDERADEERDRREDEQERRDEAEDRRDLVAGSPCGSSRPSRRRSRAGRRAPSAGPRPGQPRRPRRRRTRRRTVTPPSGAKAAWATLRSTSTKRAPAEAVPKLASPTTRTCCTPPSTIEVVSPIDRPEASIVAVSRTISPGPLGAVPATRRDARVGRVVGEAEARRAAPAAHRGAVLAHEHDGPAEVGDHRGDPRDGEQHGLQVQRDDPALLAERRRVAPGGGRQRPRARTRRPGRRPRRSSRRCWRASRGG